MNAKKASLEKQVLRGTWWLARAIGKAGLVSGVSFGAGAVNFFKDGEKIRPLGKLGQTRKHEEDRVAPFNKITAALGKSAVFTGSWLREESSAVRCSRLFLEDAKIEARRLRRKERRQQRAAKRSGGHTILRSQSTTQDTQLSPVFTVDISGPDGPLEGAEDIAVGAIAELYASRADPNELVW
ncbi:MAG TPA: hypothetical protein PKD19_00970 [Candidatus Saccharibacteria bacterium]|nr:hypothetical protein [Candidatus Saccharibacteria bacterium]HMR38196.1 hypothetical protein [Candidatus Saccharibacteria bacterium]